MNLKQIGTGLVLADFVALTAYAVWHYGYLAFFDVHAMNAINAQIFVDLCLALSMVSIWMWQDARARGVSALPYLVVTLFLGSIGPLLYLFRRAADEPVHDGVRVPHMRHA
ncbi:MAG TPA: DUF2834 domain-containing protein [Candidatus Binatia bacterium]|jgi:hypothetical protein